MLKYSASEPFSVLNRPSSEQLNYLNPKLKILLRTKILRYGEHQKKSEGEASHNIKCSALTNEKLARISLLNAKGTTMKINVSFIVHFSLGKYCFSLNIFLIYQPIENLLVLNAKRTILKKINISVWVNRALVLILSEHNL